MGGLAVTAVLSLCLAAQVAQPATEVVSDDNLPKLQATRQMLFFIPFGINGQGQNEPAFGQVETKSENGDLMVQLWVSEDRGQSWGLVEAVPASRRGFLFRAQHDGEYWFTVRTIDASGTASDSQPAKPELRVLVDTQPPVLRLDAWRGEGGQICSRWEVDETYLKPGSLQMLYRTGPQEAWQPVAIDRRAGKGLGHNDPSKADYGPWIVNWCPNTSAKFVQIRAKVVDMAGNTAISHAHVNMVDEHVDRTDTRDVVADRPQEASGNLGYPETQVGPIATISGWPNGGANRRFAR
ncbi:MAG: hypothetical protein JXM70_01915 [Pirellulales bacterium]|nr:hypothetical protein [Pirellulales bacterium]